MLLDFLSFPDFFRGLSEQIVAAVQSIIALSRLGRPSSLVIDKNGKAFEAERQ